jgi:acyl-CoA hydrolase
MKRLDIGELDLGAIVRAGDQIIWGQACAEPLTLTEALVEQRARLGGVSVFMGSCFSSTFKPEHADHIRFEAFGAVGTSRKLSRAGVLDLLPCHVSRIGPYIEQGAIACEVAFVQVAPADASGRYSLGLVSDYIRSAIRKARVVVAEVNARVPQVPCVEPLGPDEIDFLVESDRPLIEVPAAPVSDLDRAIAAIAQQYIPDRATLQVGIGAVPEAVMSLLRDRRDLGVHSGMVGDSVVELIECGALTNACKELDPGITITGALIGTRRLFDFCHRNPAVRMHPTSYTHDITVLAKLSRFISLNSAVEVDLSGQVNAENAGGQYVGAVGGQVDYVRAAAISPGGCSMIALPSTAQDGAVSRIVGSLSGPVTTARSDVDVVITEFGAAELRGRNLRERGRALIGIAHPDHREALERQWHANGAGRR